MYDEDDQKLTDDTNASQDKPYSGDNPLANDFATPAAPPEDVDDSDFPVDHPSTDTDMDEQEVYDAGRHAAASGIDAGDDNQDLLGDLDINEIA